MGAEHKLLGEFEQMIVAAVLRLGEEAYGVTIIEDIERRTGRRVRSGALSVSLDRMERKGLLRTRAGRAGPPGTEGAHARDAAGRSSRGEAPDARGGRPRRYVEVTPAGLAAARASRRTLLAAWEGLDEVYEGP